MDGSRPNRGARTSLIQKQRGGSARALAAIILIALASPATVLPAQESFVIVHAVNPEGVILNTIADVGGIEIYDGQTPLGGVYNYLFPYPVSPGSHNIAAVFNGTRLEQSVNLTPGQTVTLRFEFPRTEFDIAGWIDGASIEEDASAGNGFNLLHPGGSSFYSDVIHSNKFWLFTLEAGANICENAGSGSGSGQVEASVSYSVTSTSLSWLRQAHVDIQGTNIRHDARVWLFNGHWGQGRPISIPAQPFTNWYVQYLGDGGNYPLFLVFPETDCFGRCDGGGFGGPLSTVGLQEFPARQGYVEANAVIFFAKELVATGVPCIYQCCDEPFTDTGVEHFEGHLTNLRMSSVPYDLAGVGVIPPEVGNPPNASFIHSPAIPFVEDLVSFSDTSTDHPTEWAWHFGDGGTSTEQNPSHIFSVPRDYEVSLTASNGSGSGSTTRTIHVRDHLGATLSVLGPQSGRAGEVLHFIANAVNCVPDPMGWVWASDGGFSDGLIGTSSFEVSWNSPGTKRVTVHNVGCGNAEGLASVSILRDPSLIPQIIGVKRQYAGVFLPDSAVSNRFEVDVDWQGAPGTVNFSVNGGAEVRVTGNVSGASHSFRIAEDLKESFAPSTVTIVAQNAEGVASQTWSELLYVFPRPPWLEKTQPSVHEDTGEVKYRFSFEFPRPHFVDGVIRIPTWVPFLGGEMGLTESFAAVEGEVSSLGDGNVALKGKTGFTAMGKSLCGEVVGEGDISLRAPKGLSLNSASFGMKVRGILESELGIADAIPGLREAEGLPLIGGIIQDLNQHTTLGGEIGPSLDFIFSFAPMQDGKLGFKSATTSLGLDLKAKLDVDLGMVEAEAWMVGGGNFIVGVPDPFVRGMQISLEIGFKASCLGLFSLGDLTLELSRAIACSWTPGANVVCDGAIERSLSGLTDDLPIEAIERHYQQFGRYSAFAPTRMGRVGKQSASPVAETTLVTNVFLGSPPSLVEIGNGNMLLWERQDRKLPLEQSTDIDWSLNDASGRSIPASVAKDTRLELEPVAGVDSNGYLVAAWLRVANPNFSSTISRFSDLRRLFRQLAVVSSVFNSKTRKWNPVTTLTRDVGLHTDLQLSADRSGNLLLTWLSNPGGELLSTPTNPSSLWFSYWDAAKRRWNSPEKIAVGLVGVDRHAAAVNGRQAFVLIHRRAAGEKGVLDLYRWNRGRWDRREIFADGGVDNRLPLGVYDASGEGNVVWVQGGYLVHASLRNPTPSVVRPQSTSMLLEDMKLLADPRGGLCLVWRQPAINGLAQIHVKLYDPYSSTWSTDRQLTDSDEEAHAPSGYLSVDGRLHLAYLATEIARVVKQVEIGGIVREIPNVPVDGRTDLRVLEHALATEEAPGSYQGAHESLDDPCAESGSGGPSIGSSTHFPD